MPPNIHIFSGSNVIASRKAFIDYVQQLQESNHEVIFIEGKYLDNNFLQINIFSLDMFGSKRAIAIEGFVNLPDSELKSKLIKQLAGITDSPIMIWENKEVETKKRQGYPSNFIFKDFKLPNEMFLFLDQLNPDNIQQSLITMESIKDSVDENYLFLMLIRQIRLLILAKGNQTQKILPWQAVKLKHQAGYFSEAQLIKLYCQLRDIDYFQKTSQAVGGYYTDIQFIIADI